MLKGLPSNLDPLVSFDLSGPANGGKNNWYGWDYKDFGPRVSFALVAPSPARLAKEPLW